jgi:hypothetical protein
MVLPIEASFCLQVITLNDFKMPGADAEGIYYVREEADTKLLYDAIQEKKGVRFHESISVLFHLNFFIEEMDPILFRRFNGMNRKLHETSNMRSDFYCCRILRIR